MLFNRFSNIISIYTLHFYFTKMKHKSTKNVNNNVTKKVCVLFFLLGLSFILKIKLSSSRLTSLSSKEINQQTITTLDGNIIFQKGSMLLYGDTAIQSSQNNILKLSGNVKIDRCKIKQFFATL